MHIKKGDKVLVLTGKDKGKTGTVARALPALDRIVVTGVNISKIHKKARKSGEKGQIIEQASPMHVSNVKLVEGAERKVKARPAKAEKKTKTAKKTK